jgi:hypothetical protein
LRKTPKPLLKDIAKKEVIIDYTEKGAIAISYWLAQMLITKSLNLVN